MASELLRLRIGTTILVRLPLQINGETVDLEDYNVTVFLIDPRKNKIPVDFEIEGEDMDTIKFTYEGKDQEHFGLYRLEVYINYGVLSMAAYDRDAFVLVPQTAYENDGVESIATASLILDSGTMLVSSRDGVGISNITHNANGTLTITLTDGTEYITGSIKGDTGDAGNGISGISMNQNYTLTIFYTNGTYYTTPSIRGEQGETYNLTSADKQEIASTVLQEGAFILGTAGTTEYNDF